MLIADAASIMKRPLGGRKSSHLTPILRKKMLSRIGRRSPGQGEGSPFCGVQCAWGREAGMDEDTERPGSGMVVHGRLRQADGECKADLDYTGSLRLAWLYHKTSSQREHPGINFQVQRTGQGIWAQGGVRRVIL